MKALKGESILSAVGRITQNTLLLCAALLACGLRLRAVLSMP